MYGHGYIHTYVHTCGRRTLAGAALFITTIVLATIIIFFPVNPKTIGESREESLVGHL